MNIIGPIAVTGTENMCDDGGALDALIGFYRAFNAGDLAALQRNWMGGAEPSMDNPISGIRRGWDEICAGYERLFSGAARVTVEFYDYTQQEGADWALFVGRERGICEAHNRRVELAIRTSRWFVRHNGDWRQLHHHGSIENSTMLAEYQRMVVGAPLREGP